MFLEKTTNFINNSYSFCTILTFLAVISYFIAYYIKEHIYPYSHLIYILNNNEKIKSTFGFTIDSNCKDIKLLRKFLNNYDLSEILSEDNYFELMESLNYKVSQAIPINGLLIYSHILLLCEKRFKVKLPNYKQIENNFKYYHRMTKKVKISLVKNSDLFLIEKMATEILILKDIKFFVMYLEENIKKEREMIKNKL